MDVESSKIMFIFTGETRSYQRSLNELDQDSPGGVGVDKSRLVGRALGYPGFLAHELRAFFLQQHHLVLDPIDLNRDVMQSPAPLLNEPLYHPFRPDRLD